MTVVLLHIVPVNQRCWLRGHCDTVDCVIDNSDAAIFLFRWYGSSHASDAGPEWKVAVRATQCDIHSRLAAGCLIVMAEGKRSTGDR